MAKKSTSRALQQARKHAREAGTLTLAIKSKENKITELKSQLSQLEVEFEEKTFELKTKSCSIEYLQKQIAEKNIHLDELAKTNSTLLNAISTLDRENSSLRVKISRMRSKFSANSSMILMNEQPKEFSISVKKAVKRKAVPFTSDLSPRSKKLRCDEVFKACSLILGGQ